MRSIHFSVLAANLLLCALAQAGMQTDSVRSVHRKICFEFSSPSGGATLVVKAGDSSTILSQAAPCIDSSLSFRSFTVEQVSTVSSDLRLVAPLAFLGTAEVGSDTTVSGTNALRSEAWTFTVNRGYLAPTLITRSFSKGDSSWAEMLNIDYLWPSARAAEVASRSSSGLALRSAQGRHVELSVPTGEVAQLRLYALSGRLLESRTVAAGTGSIELTSVPLAGSLVDLRCGSERSLHTVLP